MAKANTSKTGAKTVALVVSEKGGVGKSAFTRALVDHLRTTLGVTVAAYDGDGSVGGLVRVLGTRDEAGSLIPDQDPSVGVGYYAIRNDKDRMKLLNTLGDGHALSIHDLAGGSLDDVMGIADQGKKSLEGFIGAFERRGYKIVLFHVLSSDIGSAQSVGRWIDVAGDQVSHVAVKNLRFSDFPYWDGFTTALGAEKGGKARARLLDIGGVEIEMPNVPDGTFAKIDAENLPFSVAEDTPALSIAEQTHAYQFRKDFAKAVAPALPLLGIN